MGVGLEDNQGRLAPGVSKGGIFVGTWHDRHDIAEKRVKTKVTQNTVFNNMKEYSVVLEYLYNLEKFGKSLVLKIYNGFSTLLITLTML